MPGIAGLLTHSRNPENLSTVETMIESMKHESFYRSGVYSDEDAGVHVGWTAMEEGSCPTQPVSNEDGQIVLFLSGECFAEPALLTSLKAKGHLFSDKSGQWLVHYYEETGDSFYEKLNGIFSGLLIDKRRNVAILFNDRYGIERIYTHQNGDKLYFSSEAKAILKVVPETRYFNRDALAQFINYNCTVNWHSLYKGINLLPGASLLEFSKNGITQKKYFNAREWESQEQLTEKEFIEQYEAVFDRIIPQYVASNHPLGISLTAGLDTRMIMACLPEIYPKPTCYTFGGVSGRTLDASIASRVSEAKDLKHSIIRVEDDFFSGFNDHVDRSVYISDGNFGATGAHEVYMNSKARRLARVRLTGNFGGEILRGVSTFKPIKFSPNMLSADLRSEVANCAETFGKEEGNPFTFAAFKEIPWNLYGSLVAGRSQQIFRSPYLDNDLVKLAYRSPEKFRTSRVGAVHYIQSRSPTLARIPTDKSYLGNSNGVVTLFKKLYSNVTFKLDYYNNEGLPSLLSPIDPVLRRLTKLNIGLGHHKHLHYRTWFRYELSKYLLETFNDSQIRNNSIWNKNYLKKISEEHVDGRRNYVSEINTILTIAGIERTLLKSQ